jgi:hypothetical protein
MHARVHQVYHGTEGLHNMLGSAYYVAPEVIRDGKVTSQYHFCPSHE